MKKVKIKNKLILLIGVILLSGISLYGCGKKDGDEIVGKEFKVIHRNKTEAIMKFGENNELTIISAQGKYNAGQEFRGKYQLKEKDGKLFLISSSIPTDLLDLHQDNTTGARYQDENKKTLWVHILERDGTNFKVYVAIEKGINEHFDNIKNLRQLNKYERDGFNVTLEPLDKN